jgi:acyl-CoA synthetase (AMP-forming)/AMP-acid ligase II
MKEYKDVCTRTRAVIKVDRHNWMGNKTDNRWLQTGMVVCDILFRQYLGDIGYFDTDGYFYIVDRAEDLINVNGTHVCVL